VKTGTDRRQVALISRGGLKAGSRGVDDIFGVATPALVCGVHSHVHILARTPCEGDYTRTGINLCASSLSMAAENGRDGPI
jgi:hypothetical protein